MPSDPTTSVKTKPKAARGSHKNPTQVPEFSSTDYLQVQSNFLPAFGDDQETRYLERLKLRSKLNQIAPNSVPMSSDYESMMQSVLEELNEMYKKDDRESKANLEILYARMGSKNIFNIACSIATSRLQKQSIKEYERLVENPTSAVDAILGVGDFGKTNAQVRTNKLWLMDLGSTSGVRTSVLGGSGAAVPSGSGGPAGGKGGSG